MTTKYAVRRGRRGLRRAALRRSFVRSGRGPCATRACVPRVIVTLSTRSQLTRTRGGFLFGRENRESVTSFNWREELDDRLKPKEEDVRKREDAQGEKERKHPAGARRRREEIDERAKGVRHGASSGRSRL